MPHYVTRNNVPVHAQQWTGSNFPAFEAFAAEIGAPQGAFIEDGHGGLRVQTITGGVTCNPNDFVVVGSAGYCYVISPADFNAIFNLK